MLSYRTPFLLGCSMAVVLVIGFVPASLCADVVYVKAGPQPGTENGESWPTAWNTLQEGIAHANAYDIRWVAKGTYKAGSGYGDSFAFDGAPPYPQTPKPLQLYGGLAGTETTLEFNPPYVDNRDFVANESILSGDLDSTTHSQVIVSFTDVDETWRLDGFTLEGCRSYQGNEGHAIKCETSYPILANLLIRHNMSSNVGAGLYLEGAVAGQADISACTFRENTASGSGGAVWCGDGQPEFTDCLFFANESNASGGAVFSSGNPTLRRCTFTANRAWGNWGGAIRAQKLNLRDCIFESNGAMNGGGAVACDGGQPVLIVKSRFVNNAAIEGIGGGLLFEGASARMIDCEVTGSSATGDGGGLWAWESNDGDGVEMTNCLITRNRTDAGGGGLYYWYSNPSVPPTSVFTNCTIADNHAVAPNGWTGGVALMSDWTPGPQLINSILWGNVDGYGNQESQISWYDDPPPVDYSCIQNLGTYLGTNNDYANPFPEPPTGDYRLYAGSPSQNAGYNAAVPADDQNVDDDVPPDTSEATPDLDLHVRVVDLTVDRGAYEVQAAPDCNQDGISDSCAISCDAPGCSEVTGCGQSQDCNGNGVPDDCDLDPADPDGNGMVSADANNNDIPDECDPDCNGDNVPDDINIAQSTSLDLNLNGVPDECESPIIGQWTSEADFNLGTRINVSWAEDVGGLKRNIIENTAPLPYIWVALSGKGTIVRIRTEDEPEPGTGKAGDILGEYWTTPGNFYASPSRTTVDLDSNCYVGNRYDDRDPPGPAIAKGSVAKFGLVIGGERVDRNGSPDPNGEYLKPPFQYCTCQDRDGDGLIHTSRGQGDVYGWTDASDEDSDGGITSVGDECILGFERPAGTGVRTLAIDSDNNIWIGGHVNQKHEKRDGEDLTHVLEPPVAPGCGGYGGLVAHAYDGQYWHEFLWSARSGNGLLRLHTYDATHTDCPDDSSCWVCESSLGDYGLGFDPYTGRIWQSSSSYDINEDYMLHEIDPWVAPGGGMAEFHPYLQSFSSLEHGAPAKGVAVSNNGDVWVAESNDYSDGNEVLRFPAPVSPSAYHGDAVSISGFDGTTGVAADGAGNIWITEKNIARISRYNPNANPPGVDLTVDLGFKADPYNYSDMTGLVGLHTSGTGTWSVVHDSHHEGTEWCQVRWNEDENGIPCSTPPTNPSTPPEPGDLVIEARASDNVAALAGVDYTPVQYDEQHWEYVPLENIVGRFIQVRVRFHGSYPGQAFSSPSLCNLRVVPVSLCDGHKGDLNFDTLVNGLDIQPFVDIAVGQEAPSPLLLCRADMNYDGAVDTADIPCFVQLLLTGTSSCTDPCVQGFGGINGNCNNNSLPDANDIFGGTSQDCNKNWIPDECDVDPADPDNDGLVSADTDSDGIPDECEPDCNSNGRPDDADIACGGGNTCGGIPGSYDRNNNGIPDECERDCNANGIPDDLDVSQQTSEDCNGNGVPDECERDCNGNDIPDDCDIDPSDPDGDTIVWPDCNGNLLPDVCDLSWAPPRGSTDCNDNDIPDECDIANCAANDPSCQDCNANGIPDACDIAAQISLDEDEDGIPDECEEGGRMSGEMMPSEGLLFGGDPEAWQAAWAAYWDWARDQTWGPNSEYTGAEQYQRLVAKLQELGLPLSILTP